MSLPPTNIAVRLKTQSDCECPVDPCVLFAPGDERKTLSHVFIVAEGDSHFAELYEQLPAGAHISFERETTVCGHTHLRPALDLCKNPLEIRADCPQLVINIPGRYKARLVLPDPEADFEIAFLLVACPLGMSTQLNHNC